MPGLVRALLRNDVAIAALLALASVAELFAVYAFERVTPHHPQSWHFVFAIAAASALTWRRSHPLVVAPLVAGLFALEPEVTTQPNVYSAAAVGFVAIYSLAVYAPSWEGGSISASAVLVLFYLQGLHDPGDPIGVAVTNALIVLVVLGASLLVRRHRDRADQAERRAQRVAADERARIARELHDVVAHGMSVVVLQARGGRRVLDSQPERARQALDDIERVASECLEEMRRLLGILRATDPDSTPLAPQPKLPELRWLVNQARDSGASVELVVDGDQRELAPAVELSAYRIAQEALTNALKHAPGSHAVIHLTYEDDAVRVEVTDDGHGTTTAVGTDRQGHGLIGMRERVELFGGSFDAGARPGGGFGVFARLPTAGAST